MTEPIFFEIPIYRCSLQSHTIDMQLEEAKIIESVPKELYPESHQSILNNFHTSLWYPWKYNEIIGYLNLYIMGGQFRANIFMVDKKRYDKGITKKKYISLGKTLERHIPRSKSSEEIFKFIIEELVNLNKRDYEKFHFDLRTFKVVGNFINWLELVEKLNSYKYPAFRKAYFEGEK